MTRTPVTSSNIAAVSYDVITQDLEVEFKNGATYVYRDVPHEDALALSKADSVGKHLNEHIKPRYKASKKELTPPPVAPTAAQVYEFGAMSSVMTVEASDPKVAVATALLWANGFPLLVCYSHEEANPATIIGGAALEGGSTSEALAAWLGQDVDAFFEANADAIRACNESMQRGKRTDRRAA